MIKAIETRYKGYRFRSRLEARWAVFFDTLGIQWEYEKEGYDLGEAGWYLPDFWLPEHKCWIEVKGGDVSDGDQRKIDALRETQQVIVFGEIPSSADDWHDDFDGLVWRIPISEDVDQKTWLVNGDNGYSSGETVIVCPVCGYDYVHIHGVKDARNGVAIEMSCENNHEWAFSWHFHKGYTLFSVVGAVSNVCNTGLVLAGGDHARLTQALVAARSARFEHGENGSPAPLSITTNGAPLAPLPMIKQPNSAELTRPQPTSTSLPPDHGPPSLSKDIPLYQPPPLPPASSDPPSLAPEGWEYVIRPRTNPTSNDTPPM